MARIFETFSVQVSVECRASVGQVSAKCRPSIGEVSAKSRRGIGDLKSYVGRHTCRKANRFSCRKAMPADIHIGRLSVDSRSLLDRYSIDSRSPVDRQSTDMHVDRRSTECRWSIDRVYIDRLSTATSTDIAVDITYSKHDPRSHANRFSDRVSRPRINVGQWQ